MKKVLYYICISVALYTFISCSNEQDLCSGPKGNTKISVSIDNHTTRVSVDHSGKTVWSKGDESPFTLHGTVSKHLYLMEMEVIKQDCLQVT